MVEAVTPPNPAGVGSSNSGAIVGSLIANLGGG